jgi:hypothetical protein
MSGGGIKSAIFKLGVLQALHAAGVFKRVDYASTVSGGGYIGTCVSVLVEAPGTAFPFEPRSHVLRWVCDRSQYLPVSRLWLRVGSIVLLGV